MNPFVWSVSPFAIPAIGMILQVAVMGEDGVPNAGLHPVITRHTVYAARIALGWVLLVVTYVAVSGLWR